MKFDYRVLNDITNQDFQTCGAQLLRYCKEIERKYNAGELRDCCRDARVANEVLLRYLYKRLLSSGGEPTAGMILQSPEFAQKIGDIELIVAAEKVQKTGNQYSHAKAYDNETREQYENRMKLEDAKLIFIVDDLLEKLTTVLEHAVTIINPVPEITDLNPARRRTYKMLLPIMHPMRLMRQAKLRARPKADCTLRKWKIITVRV